MNEQIDKAKSGIFASYAGLDISKWKLIDDCEVTHQSFGVGIIDKITILDESPNISITFFNIYEVQKTKSFGVEAFVNEITNIDFNYYMVPEFNCFITSKLKEVSDHLLKEKLIKEQEEKARREQEEKEKKALREQEVKEKAHLAEFRKLKDKYGLANTNINSVTSPLYMILIKFESGEYLSGEDIGWIENEALFALLARHYERNFKRTKDYWDLVKASSNYRKAKEPEKAVTLLKNITVDNEKLRAAILTSRSAAHKDLEELEESERLAIQASSFNNSSYHPYNVLGSIYYQRGLPEKGDVFFNKAIELGSSQRSMDNEIRNVLKAAGEDEKIRVAKYLLKKDAQKYNWARFYINE